MNTKFYSLVICVLFLSCCMKIATAQNSGTWNMQIVADAYVSEESPASNYGISAELVAGRGLEFGYLNRTYMKFDHTPIPPDAEVVSAQLYVYMYYATAETYNLELRKVTAAWAENTVNWNNQPGSANRVFIRSAAVDDEAGWKSFDITSTVGAWIEGQENNEGLVLMADNESGDMQNCRFYSRESGGCKPYIQVVYLTDSVVPESPDAPVCNITGDDTPPELSIDFSKSPLLLGDFLTVTASARDNEGIHIVQLYRGSTLIGSNTDEFNAHSISASNVVVPAEAGPIMFFAVAYNDRMQCTRVSKRLLVQVDGEAPVVTIYHLPEHPAMGESVTFYASADDPSGIANLSIEVNGYRNYLAITPGASSVSGSLQIANAGIFYDPATTRVVSYAATAYDREGNHTTYGPHTVVFGEGSGTDSDGDGIDDDLEEILGIDPESDDTDGDGLYDYWEVFGVDRDNDGDIDLDLPGYGASPHHKDLFIEMDWMEDATHSHKPHPWTIQTAINQFLCYDIRLHVDAGSMGGGNAVQHILDMGEGDTKLNHLLDIKQSNCDPARFGIFRYALYGHGWGQYFGTGNMTLRSDPPNTSNDFDEPYFQARQLIHETGHSLALGHGGQSRTEVSQAYSLDQECCLMRNDVASWINTNYKPNYVSIMNYLYEERNGLRARTSGGDDIIIQGFSQNPYRLNDLNENHLNESAGFEYPLYWGMYTWRRQGETMHRLNDWFEGDYYIRYNSQWILADGSPIDWDNDGNDSETDVSADINNDGHFSLLTSENDVDNFVLQIRSSHTDRFMANENSYVITPVTIEVCDGADNDSDGMIDEGFPDLDKDGVADFIDNALNAYNPLQADVNQNFIGDYVEIPLKKVTSFNGNFDKVKTASNLTWNAPNPAPALLGYNVYRKDRKGNFKRLGVSYPSALEAKFTDNGPFSLEVEDTLTYYVRPVNLYMMEGIQSEYMIFHPSIHTTGLYNDILFRQSFRCYPNPFTLSTRISYNLPESGNITIMVYNLLGEKVNNLIDAWQPAGSHTIEWDGTGISGQRLPAGCYIGMIRAGNTVHTFRIILSN